MKHSIITEEGKYRCQTCHALSLTRGSFDLFPCREAKAVAQPKTYLDSADLYHEQDFPPEFPMLGTLWYDTSHTKSNNIWAYSEYGSKGNYVWRNVEGAMYHAVTVPGIESLGTHRHVKKVQVVQAVTRELLEQGADGVVQKIKDEVQSGLLNMMQRENIIRVTEPRLELAPDPAVGITRFNMTCMGRPIPAQLLG